MTDETTEIEFVAELPTEGVVPGRGAAAWGHDIAPQLRNCPGMWALIWADQGAGQKINNRSATISRGLTSPWAPDGTYEAQVLRMADGTRRLYARYVGGGAQ